MKSAAPTFDQLPDSALINTKTVSDLFGGLSLTTLWRWVKNGDLPQPTRIGGRKLWSVADVRRTLADKTNPSN